MENFTQSLDNLDRGEVLKKVSHTNCICRVIYMLACLSIEPVLAFEFEPLSGKVEMRSGYYLNHSDESSNSMGQGLLKFEKTATSGDFTFKLAPVTIFNVQDLEQNDEGRIHFESSELWGDYSSENVDVFAGRQIIKWGAADGLNPTNFFRAYDISDPYFPKELSQNLIGIRFHPSSMSKAIFEVIYVPHASVDILPFRLEHQRSIDPSDSRWGTAFPTSLEVNNTSKVPLKYRMDGQSHNDASDLGARFRLLQIHHWDYSFVVGKFRRKRPLLAFDLEGDASDPNLPLTIRFRPYFPRSKLIGFDASGSFGETGFRLEAAKSWVEQEDRAFGYDSLIINGGLDHLFSNLMDGELYLNFAYVFIENRKYSEFLNQSLDLSFTEDYLTFRSEWRGNEWTFGNDLLLNVYGNYLNHVSVKYGYGPSLNLGLVASFVKGELRNGIGNFNDNHRLTAILEYFF